MIKLDAKQLRKSRPVKKELAKIKRKQIYIVLDDVLDTYNVGAIFRLVDAVAASKIYLCGETATPDDPKVGHKIVKASVSTHKWVPWEYVKTAKEAVLKIRKTKHEIINLPCRPASPVSLSQGGPNRGEQAGKHQIPNSKFQIIAIEQYPGSVSYDKIDYKLPLALIVGNETFGVSKEVLKLVDQIVEIPMSGVNKSLNVMVSLGIVLYEVVKRI